MEQVKILSALCTVLPILGLILGYWLCNRENKVQIQLLEENHKVAIQQLRVVCERYQDTIEEQYLKLHRYIPEIWGQAIQEDEKTPEN